MRAERRMRIRRAAVSVALAAVVAFSAYTVYLAATLVGVRLPVASGIVVYSSSGTTVDASNTSQGYIMAKHTGSSKRLKFRVIGGGKTETYDLNNAGGYEVFPLQYGSGSYELYLYEQVSGTQYSPIFYQAIYVQLEDENISFLYPNQYVNYDSTNESVVASYAACVGISDARGKLDAVCEYVRRHIVYDYIKALTVSTGYLPDVDETLDEGMGICFDISALVACMLRAQDVPTRMMIGDAGSAYHAWNSAYVDGDWVLVDITAELTGMRVDDDEYIVERFY